MINYPSRYLKEPFNALHASAFGFYEFGHKNVFQLLVEKGAASDTSTIIFRTDKENVELTISEMYRKLPDIVFCVAKDEAAYAEIKSTILNDFIETDILSVGYLSDNYLRSFATKTASAHVIVTHSATLVRRCQNVVAETLYNYMKLRVPVPPVWYEDWFMQAFVKAMSKQDTSFPDYAQIK